MSRCRSRKDKEVLQLIAQQWRQVGVALTVKAGDAGSRTLDNLDPQKTPLTVSRKWAAPSRMW